MLNGKTIVLGVTGGIAVYKSAYLTSGLKKLGAEVVVCMTENAKEFVSPLTFEVLSNAPVLSDMFEREKPWDIEHISLAERASLFIIAPATANIIAKIANGIADDFLSTTILAATCPIIIVPAMNTNMFNDESTVKNLKTLEQRGFFVMDTDAGLLACGDIGEGRMKEPEEIIEYAKEVLKPKCDFAGKKVLVSAGPTREYIDAVRYITNPSSGKMGYALAQNAIDRGAHVTLVSGPVSLEKPIGAEIIQIETAKEMDCAVSAAAEEADIIIMAAAVADYTPKTAVLNKMKKAGDISIELIRTTDILEKLGQDKGNKILVGFAAETDDVEKNAVSKLKRKNLDIIALNDITDVNSGFEKDTNHIYLFKRDGSRKDLGIETKHKTASMILDEIINLPEN